MTNHNLRKNVTYMLTENLRCIILYNIYSKCRYFKIKCTKFSFYCYFYAYLSFIVKLGTIFPDIIIMLDLA
jgi:hypothetical protein